MISSARRGRGESAGLSRESVVAAAERVIDRTGFDRMSLRAVAVELGVTSGALYNHFASKQALLDAVAGEFIAREVLHRLPKAAEPLDLVRTLTRRLHAAGLAHPTLLSAVVGHIPAHADSPQMEVAAVLLGALRAAGVPARRIGVVYRSLLALALGNAIYDSNVAATPANAFDERLRMHIERSPFPEVSLYIEGMPRPGERMWFDEQLDLILSASGAGHPSGAGAEGPR